jgi:glutamate 5-kinase
MSAQVRERVAHARRVVVKIGSSSLTQGDGRLDAQRIAELASHVSRRRALGHEVLLVSSGSIAAGFPALGLDRRPKDLATQQAAASVGQSMLIAEYSSAFATHHVTVGQVLLTAAEVERRSQYRNAQRTLFRLLELGIVPIINENDTVATDEIRFGDNDRLAALVAHLVNADALVLLSDVDGLYDGPPDEPGTVLIPDVADARALEGVRVSGPGAAGVGLGGMRTKIEAAAIASSAGIPVLLTSAGRMGDALTTAEVGTVFHPTGERTSARRLWLAHATSAAGRLVLDDGAVAAVMERGSSLLPAGITEVQGLFMAGDPVDLVDQNGTTVARGLVNFDAAELPSLLGRSTRELARELGPEYEREVVHRDDLVILVDR